jgi:hypothetical protein
VGVAAEPITTGLPQSLDFLVSEELARTRRLVEPATTVPTRVAP